MCPGHLKVEKDELGQLDKHKNKSICPDSTCYYEIVITLLLQSMCSTHEATLYLCQYYKFFA